MSLISFLDPFGTVPGSSLNWSQHALLAKQAGGRTVIAGGPTIDTGRICQAIESVGQNVADVVDAIDSLVDELDVRLDEQAELLSRQADLLAEIAQTLHSPARTRAAERIRDATELLRHHRNERALAVAEQAIDDDPNNDAAFLLAGWASVGLQYLQRARGYFREAGQATASTQDAVTRHMNAVHLAARLTFALDGPDAALRELDGAEPFVDPAAQRKHPEYSKLQLTLSRLEANKAGGIKFDRAVYYLAGHREDSALQALQELTEEHDIRFCLMALTDPILSNSEAIVNVAREAWSIYRALVDEVNELLPLGETSWPSLWPEVQLHEIRDADTMATGNRLDELLNPNSGTRETFAKPPSKRWLEEVAAVLRTFSPFEARMRPLIERERMREEALNARARTLSRRPTSRLVHRTRLEAVVGTRNVFIGGFRFRRITVDGNGQVSVTEQKPTQELMSNYETARRR